MLKASSHLQKRTSLVLGLSLLIVAALIIGILLLALWTVNIPAYPKTPIPTPTVQPQQPLRQGS